MFTLDSLVQKEVEGMKEGDEVEEDVEEWEEGEGNEDVEEGKNVEK